MKNRIESRRRRYFDLSSQIAQMDSRKLAGLFESSGAIEGWGRNHVIDVGRSKVFVKRVPITGIERDNLFSTQNLYDLPTYYNYGIGSAGFGVSRELVAHIKTTNWVLNGDCEGFPLMYHYRIVPASGEKEVVDVERHKRYVEYWGGSANIGKYMLDRADADHELVLFIEYMPEVLRPWLGENPDRVGSMLEDLFGTIAFLRKNGVIHFDAHFHNILTDGDRTYLTDFGLVLDRGFDLTEEELRFFKQHSHYDYGLVLSCIAFILRDKFDSLPENVRHEILAKYGLGPNTDQGEIMSTLIDHTDDLPFEPLSLDKRYCACLNRHRKTIQTMHRFYSTLRANPNKDTKFPQRRLLRHLLESGVVGSS
ncbi:hypothetical protein [Fimbriimonas ginsengisoli]|uniref:Protein kinase domain-containing protein n=1 Tax=Fimbriimonas ginsengisoli Gsoil 348 TaxID=661478 RepID=A0A068NM78_FIMGI|nr:hypothetical protein [Fimbriimonas ginsengisoli]AIE84522.1 hypothetical protein OP10G_1154 [Fimbriimonas ginsengisoli Gsoil 348]